MSKLNPAFPNAVSRPTTTLLSDGTVGLGGLISDEQVSFENGLDKSGEWYYSHSS